MYFYTHLDASLRDTVYPNENCEFFTEQDQRWALVCQEAILSSELHKRFQMSYKAARHNPKMLSGKRQQAGQGPSPQGSLGNQLHQPQTLRILASTLSVKALFSSSTYPEAILERSQEGIRKLNLCKTRKFSYL